MQELLHLDLSGTAVEDADLAHLTKLPRLQSLRINNQPALDDISDAGLAEISRVSALRCLEVKGNQCITAAGLAPSHAIFPPLQQQYRRLCMSATALNNPEHCTSMRFCSSLWG